MNRIVAALVFLMGCAEPERDRAIYDCDLPARFADNPHPRAAELDEVLRTARASRFPGATMYLRDAEGVYVGASGSADLDLGVDMEGCHRTRIASVTKTMAAVAALRLAEDGELGLDEGIETYIPTAVADRFDHTGAMTTRQLLQHTTGIPDYASVLYGIRGFNRPQLTYDRDWCLDFAARRRATGLPGISYAYSNTGYIVLGHVMEGATGKAHADVIAQEVFAPLGMGDSTYAPEDVNFERQSRGYLDFYSNGRLTDVTEVTKADCFGPDGSAVSPVYELGEFVEAVFRERTILSDATLEDVTRWVDDPDFEGGQGLGFYRWDTDYGEAIGHDGFDWGYVTSMQYYPDSDVTLVLAANASEVGDAPEFLHALTGIQEHVFTSRGP